MSECVGGVGGVGGRVSERVSERHSPQYPALVSSHVIILRCYLYFPLPIRTCCSFHSAGQAFGDRIMCAAGSNAVYRLPQPYTYLNTGAPLQVSPL